MKKLSYLLLLAIVSFTSCTKDKGDDDQAPILENYVQGRIEYSYTFTNPTLAKYVNYIKESDKRSDQTIEEAFELLTDEEQQTINNFRDDNPMGFYAIYTLPIIKNEIFISDNHTRSNTHSLSYNIEKAWDIRKGTGSYYIENESENNLSFTFDLEFAKGINTLSPISTEELYNRSELNENATVFGFNTKVINYALKTIGQYDFTSNIKIYVSEQIRKEANILHFMHTNEEHGIVKMEIDFKNSDMGKLIYEVTKVEARAVTAGELDIKVAPEHITDKDFDTRLEINEKLLNLMSFLR
jgi:hypothetical protein